MRLFRKKFILPAAIAAVLVIAAGAAAQDSEKIASGDYGSLIIAVNAKDELTGYFDERTGDDGHGRPRFSCAFFIYGEKQPDGTFRISTWYPGLAEDEVITGKLKYSGKARVNIKLDGEHGGCWNVAPSLKEKEGVDFDLESAGRWEGVRMIAPSKAYFFMSPQAGAPQKIYVVRNDAVRVLSIKGEWAEVGFVGANGRTTKGWMKDENFYSIKPPAK